MRSSQKLKITSFLFVLQMLFLNQNVVATNTLYLSLTGKTVTTVLVVRGPYLQSGTPNSIVIKWRTSEDTESVINYGTSLGNLATTLSEPTPKSDHEITISGLSASTIYYYEIANLSEILVPQDADLYFKTSPPTGEDALVNIWVLGDCGTANSNQREVRDAFYNYNGDNHIDLMLLLGDNAYSDGTDLEYQSAIFENMYEEKLQNTVVWSTLGNHDGHAADSDTQTGPYYEIFTFPTQAEAGGVASGTEAYYSFDYANAHFIILDSYESDRDVGGAMYNWAESDIQNSVADWNIAFWHHPAYSKGSHDSDNCSKCSDMRENFLPMLEDNGVDLVMAGHSHSYERSYFLNGHYGESNTFDPNIHTVPPTGYGDGKIDGNGAYEKDLVDTEGAVYIVAGSSGKTESEPLNHPAHYFSIAELGSLSIKIDGNELNTKFVRETGNIDDYFSILKLEPLPVDLHSLNAQVQQEKVKLSWKTEVENSDFEIYRSIDSNPGRSGWKKIGRVNGVTSSDQDYFFYDEHPMQGINYYRLKMKDLDGSYDFTDVVAVEYYGENMEIQLFPNPAQNKIFVDAKTNLAIDELKVVDLSGNTLMKSNNESILDISGLSNGIYLMNIKIGQKIYRKRFVVLR